MPRRAVEHGLGAGVNVFTRPASPLFAARNQFDFNDALCSQRHGDFAIQVLLGGGHINTAALAQRGEDLWLANDLRKMWRANFLFAFRDQNQIDRELATGTPYGMQGCDER